MQQIPKPGEIYYFTEDKPYQIVSIAEHYQTGECMVVYQSMFGSFKTYIKPMSIFMEELNKEWNKEAIHISNTQLNLQLEEIAKSDKSIENDETEGTVSQLLLDFLDAVSCQKKLEVLTSNRKHINDRLINDMAASLDCTIEEGPLEKKISELIYCLQAMSRFEDRRLR